MVYGIVIIRIKTVITKMVIMIDHDRLEGPLIY
jgi:hypothetical protein